MVCPDTGFRDSGLTYVSRQECPLHLFKLLFEVSLERINVYELFRLDDYSGMKEYAVTWRIGVVGVHGRRNKFMGITSKSAKI